MTGHLVTGEAPSLIYGPLPDGMNRIVLSQSAADKLKVGEGDEIAGSLTRRYRGAKERTHIDLSVAAVAPPAADLAPDPQGFERRFEDLANGFVDLRNRHRRGRRPTWISDLPESDVESDSGTWSVDGNELTLTFAEEEGDSLVYTLDASGNMLLQTYVEDDDIPDNGSVQRSRLLGLAIGVKVD